MLFHIWHKQQIDIQFRSHSFGHVYHVNTIASFRYSWSLCYFYIVYKYKNGLWLNIIKRDLLAREFLYIREYDNILWKFFTFTIVHTSMFLNLSIRSLYNGTKLGRKWSPGLRELEFKYIQVTTKCRFSTWKKKIKKKKYTVNMFTLSLKQIAYYCL